MERKQYSDFAGRRLPWLVAVGALVLYGFTLNRWVSPASLGVMTNISDPSAAPPLGAPLAFLLTYPFRWLTGPIQTFALNGFSALCAALTLALLARSVALLPHDRTREQRHREYGENSLLSIWGNWGPPLFAVLLCALQISFWEHATAITGEMLNLLLFAYLIRCLLEFRVSGQESWLTKFAFVYGIATTNNHVLIAYFPVFLVALIWIRGFDFFQFRFVLRMVGWGIAGLLLYLVLPALNALRESSGIGFWEALRYQLAAQKGMVQSVPRVIALLAALTSLLPITLIGIRWPSSFGDTSAVGNLLTNWVFRIVHGLFLVAIVAVAFDAPFGPRVLTEKMMLQFPDAYAGLPFLGSYYLGALCAGYFLGYYLLVFSPSAEPGHRRGRSSGGLQVANVAVFGACWLALVSVPAMLMWKNLPPMRVNNGTLMREFARSTVDPLPPSRAILFSDQPQILSLTQTYLDQQGNRPRHLLVNSRLLPYPGYHKTLHQRAPSVWPRETALFGTNIVTRIPPGNLLIEVSMIVNSNVSFYLHPSFGYYFEPLYLRPEGTICRMTGYETNEIVPPVLDAGKVQQNVDYWTKATPHLEQVAAAVARGSSEARTVGRWYSRALNYWGVELQRLSTPRLEEAGKCFELAYRLNPDNLVAREVNLAYNRSLRAGKPQRLDLNTAVERVFGTKFRQWDDILRLNGPIDEPAFCVALGQIFLDQGLPRQAALQFLRALQFEPANVDASLQLASTYQSVGLHDRTLATVDAVRKQTGTRPLTAVEQIEFARLEALAYAGRGEIPLAERVIRSAQQNHPGASALVLTLVEIYSSSGQHDQVVAALDAALQANPDQPNLLETKALACLKLQRYADANQALARILARDPENPQALVIQGALFIQTQQYTNALGPLNRALQQQPNNMPALINRAIALLQSGQLEAAEKDYLALLKYLPHLHRVHYGLGEIAFRRQNSAKAIEHYQEYLALAPTDTEEAREVQQRLQQLKSAPKK